MKTQSKKPIKWVILLTGLLGSFGVDAQTLIGSGWTQSSPAVTTGVDTSYGTFVSTAPLNSSVSFSGVESSTSNPQFLWVPALGSLRAGSFSSAPSTTVMGTYSTAFGQNSVASGEWSFAAGGGGTTASLTGSIALGYDAIASGMSSVSLGLFSTASQTGSIALGYGTTASSSGSVAMGTYSLASGNGSIALGLYVNATGIAAISTGQGTQASGTASAAFNLYTRAPAYDSTVFGQYNVGLSSTGATPSGTSWVSTDPLFEIGDGTGSTPSDALVVYKNGTVAAHTKLRCAPGGDLSMGSFTAGTAP